MRARHVAPRGFAALVVVLLVMMLGTYNAEAIPLPGPANPSSPDGLGLPKGFPADLRKFVVGTKEFKTAPWFNPAETLCATQGGDVAMYLDAMFKDESRLLYWSQDADGRKAMWAGQTVSLPSGADRNNLQDSEPPRLPPAFPAGENYSTYSPDFADHPIACAKNLAYWATSSNTTFGFDWATTPDPGTFAWAHDRGYDKYFDHAKNPCNDAKSIYCSKTYFLDCDTQGKTTLPPVAADQQACHNWDEKTAWLQYSLNRWVHRNDSAVTAVEHLFSLAKAMVLGGGHAAADAFRMAWQAITNAIKDFINLPKTEFDKFVNELHQNAVQFITSTLKGINHTSAWNPSKGGFLKRYALVEALGLVLMAFMFLGAIRKAQDSGRSEELAELFKRLGIGFLLMIFAPMLFQILENTATGLTDNLTTTFTGKSIGTVTGQMAAVGAVTSTHVPGGAIIGAVLFLLMLIGALGLYVGLEIQRFGVELGATLVAVMAATYVHRGWKKKVEKGVWTVVGLIAAKPVAFLVLGVAFGEIADGLSAAALQSSDSSSVLGGLTLAAVGLLVCGLAPFSLLKWAPALLPTRPDSHDSSRGAAGGAMLGAASAGLAALAGRGARAATPRSAATAGAGRAVAAGATGGANAGSAAGPLTEHYDKQIAGSAGLSSGRRSAASRAQSAGVGVSAGAGKAAGTVTKAVPVAAAAAQIGAAGLNRGRSLAHSHVPDAEPPEEEG